MSTVIFAPDHKGMKVSASGVLERRSGTGLHYMRCEMHKHLEVVATKYYAGETAIVDEFFQLYCLGEEARKAAKAKAAQDEQKGGVS
ncbi:hypothetical protein Ga0100231_023870 [Opitutaceae bacterium TAV4]|nr:hypothetical protein Ga0100231_023870 [Opitutaceae bacterium TAV4]RRK00750.1 hypothetical protein Ga0100230_023445 [Opitutaceae bacterium TAV3]